MNASGKLLETDRKFAVAISLMFKEEHVRADHAAQLLRRLADDYDFEYKQFLNGGR